MRFLKENWLFIAVPFAIVLIGAAVLAYVFSDPGPAPFVYTF